MSDYLPLLECGQLKSEVAPKTLFRKKIKNISSEYYGCLYFVNAYNLKNSLADSFHRLAKSRCDRLQEWCRGPQRRYEWHQHIERHFHQAESWSGLLWNTDQQDLSLIANKNG